MSRDRVWLLLVVLALVVGAVLGRVYAGPPAAGRRGPDLLVPVATRPVPATTEDVARNYASPACLEAVRRGDSMIHLLIRHQRGEAERLLLAYTIAARQCRQDASPSP